MAKLPTRISELPTVKLAYLANQLRAKKELLAAEPIAVIGMSCRFPGGGELPETFWDVLRDGRDATREVPADRWNIDDVYDPTPGTQGKVYTRRGAFIENVDLFEPSFFGIAPRDAKFMDPQQRMLLEECWRALERAGIPPAGLAGSRTGIFVGLMHNDYNVLGISADVEMSSSSLNYPSMAAGRISHTLGFQGPALTVDTACSSSAVTVHLACQSLRNDESDMALAGGVSLSLSPVTMMVECQNRMLSADGRCKAFDASADGFARGEGCGMVVLKRLSDALAHGDPIIGVIRGSALNHDGRSSGLMVPNGRAQERVIRMALDGCGVEPDQVSYIEAHGTGTALGDPIEMEALRSVFGRKSTRGSPLFVGSVKTNIGHLEAAAGIAGLIKVLLSLRNEAIPAHLHFERPNPNIRWDDLPVVIPTELRPWPRGEQRRLAGLSSFGFSGTNVHLVVEEAPVLPRPPMARERPVHLLTLSAKTEAALDALVEAHESALTDDSVSPGDWCFTANAGRSHFEHRAAITGSSVAELRMGLSRLRAEKPRSQREPRRGTELPKPVFLFTGQGALGPGTGRELAETWPVFREALLRCSNVLQGRLEPRLEDILWGEASASLLADTRYAQPALVALEFALSELWASWGIVPGAVAGHSLGEYAAAVVAGVLSLEDSLKLVVERARLIHEAPGEGAMLAVHASMEAVAPVVAPLAQRVSLAAVNGPEDLVLSGEAAAISEVAETLAARGITCKRLPVPHAYHSSLMDPVVAPFEACFEGVALSTPRVPFVSSLEGRLVSEELTRPGYWGRHLREPVAFAATLDVLRGQMHRTFLEVGPAPVLAGIGRRIFQDAEELCWLPSLRASSGETAQLLSSLGSLYSRGFEVDWAAFDAPFERRPATLPTYPFRRERYWLDTQTGGLLGERRVSRDKGHPLVGTPLSLAGTKVRRFTSRLSAFEPSFIADHRVFGATILPAACYAEMALGAARLTAGAESLFELSSVELERPFVLGEGEAHDVQTVLTPEAGRTHFEIYGQGSTGPERDWVRLAHGHLTEHRESTRPVQLETELLSRFSAPRPSEPLFELMARHGIEYGPSFRVIESLRFGTNACLAHVRLHDSHVVGMGAYQLHPLLLDACFQTAAALFMEDAKSGQQHRQRMPVGIERLRWFKKPGASVWVHARHDGRGVTTSDELLSCDLRILGEEGDVIAEVQGLLLKQSDRRALMTSFPDSSRELLFELAWREQEAARGRSPLPLLSGRWLLLADSGGAAQSLKAQVQRHGGTCELVLPGPGYERMEPGLARLDPSDPHAFTRLLRELAEEGASPATVVCFWGLDEPKAEALSPESLAQATSRSAAGVLHLVQAMARATWAQKPVLWLVTRGAVSAAPGDTVEGLAQSTLWGLCRAAAIEHPELSCRLVDLDDGEDAATRWFERMAHAPGENMLALRGSRLLAARLVRPPAAPSRTSSERAIHADGAYLITGGMGALGLATATWLVEEGARHLVLVGRGAPGAEAQARLLELRERGCEVTVACADISRAEDARRVVEELSARGSRPRGIFHVAGVLEDGVFLRQDRERLAKVFAPKVLGAWNLHLAAMGLPLDLFVMYSSAASLVGVAGQANYVAANTFLDALAHHRRAKGLPALSVNWGRWSGGGMAEKVRGPGRAPSSDANSLSPQRALRVLEELLGRDLAQVGVVPVNLSPREATPSAGHGPLFSELVVREPSQSAGTARMVELLEELKRSDGTRRRGLLMHYVHGRLAPLLGFPPDHEMLQRSISLNEMGLDSLRAVELKNRMGRELGVDLPLARFIDGTGVAGIVEVLHEQLELSELLARVPAAGAQVELEELTL
ncbi:type I polyketide synthase [Myxococcus stipitatus]|uniref:type I polyketide synthase n=1 Tax=Myxococcus stipitatus TaxID=83455 RepID=UPI0030D170E2